MVCNESCLPAEDNKIFMDALTLSDVGRISPSAADGLCFLMLVDAGLNY